MSEQEQQVVPRRRWPRVFAAMLGLVIAGSIFGALLNARSLEGAIPGKDPILGLGITEKGFLVGTKTGSFVSTDGVAWGRSPGLPQKRTLVATDPLGVVVLVDSTLLRSDDLGEFVPAAGSVQTGVALGADDEANIYVAEDASTLVLFLAEGGLRRAATSGGPREIVALDATGGDPVTLYAGGLTSGFWRSIDGGATWRHILKTPVRAIAVDPNAPRRIFIGTAGGVLVSKDGGSKWAFTEMRSSIEAIAAARDKIYVLTQDRLFYVSEDGLTDYKRVQQD